MPRILYLLLFLACNDGFAGEADTDALQEQAKALTQQFINELKPQLKQAMTNGGAAYAVEVCASAAPKIADTLSVESGWQVRRVSLKSRNASRAQPDAWERSILLDFNLRQAAGEPAAAISYSGMDGKRYRYLQAQGVEPLCLVCHGKGLSGPVSSVISQYYPDDWATGYSLGEVRGAISLSRDVQSRHSAQGE